MTVSYIASATAEATSLTLFSHQKGDLIFMFVYRGSTTFPSIPAGWKRVAGRSQAAQSSILCYKIAASSGETAGTWTNADMLASVGYRHSLNYILPGGFNSNSNTLTTVNYPAVIIPVTNTTTTPQMRGDSSWLAAFVGVLSNSSDVETPPSLMTFRAGLAGAAAREVAVHDTNGEVAAWASTTHTQSVSAGNHTIVCEILDTGIPKSSGIRHPFLQQVLA